MISINEKSTGKTGTKQENFHFYAKNDPTLDLTLQANPAFLADPYQFVNSLNQADRDTLSGLLWIRHKFGSAMDRKPEIFIGKDSLAAKLGYSSRHIDRVINKLISLGLISKIIGGYNLANVYKFNAIFDHPTYRSKLARFFPALRFLGVAFLCAVNMHFKENVTANKRVFILKTEAVSETEAVKGVYYSYMQKKEERKQMHIESMVDKVKLVTALKFNALGKVYLTPYHADAILWANERIQATTVKITNPLLYFKHLCSTWHKDNKQPMDFTYLDDVFKRNPDWKDFPVFEDDGQIHRSAAIKPATAASKKWYEKDRESQPSYGKPQNHKSTAVTSAAAYERKTGAPSQDPYTKPDYAHLKQTRDPFTFDRQGEFKKFIDILRSKKASGESLNPFAQQMLDSYEAQQAFNPTADGIPAIKDGENALEKLTGDLYKSVGRPVSSVGEDYRPWTEPNYDSPEDDTDYVF